MRSLVEMTNLWRNLSSGHEVMHVLDIHASSNISPVVFCYSFVGFNQFAQVLISQEHGISTVFAANAVDGLFHILPNECSRQLSCTICDVKEENSETNIRKLLYHIDCRRRSNIWCFRNPLLRLRGMISDLQFFFSAY